jgi:hypothetical protein
MAEWIKVSERLPEENGRLRGSYGISCKNGLLY